MLKGGGFKALVKQGGARNLYAGVWGNLAGVAPASAVFMAIYEPVKAALHERVPENKSFLGPLGAGSAAGLAASVIRVPTEVVKQRLQSGKNQILHSRISCDAIFWCADSQPQCLQAAAVDSVPTVACHDAAVVSCDVP